MEAGLIPKVIMIFGNSLKYRLERIIFPPSTPNKVETHFLHFQGRLLIDITLLPLSISSISLSVYRSNENDATESSIVVTAGFKLEYSKQK
jgi:hypothetical protein